MRTGCENSVAILAALLSPLVLLGCHSETAPSGTERGAPAPTRHQDREITALIEQLALEEGEGLGRKQRRQREEACRTAFRNLSAFKKLAFPALLEHLDDDRPSVHFGWFATPFATVGDACWWNMYRQLLDLPEDYLASFSGAGWSRLGRDGKLHPFPINVGEPFEAAGGMKPWIEKNLDLSYPEMQIKCLQRLLDRERDIGIDLESGYFHHILPLEIRILERRLENGETVETELRHLERIRDERLVDEVPQELKKP